MKVNIALLTVTDTRNIKTDKSGAILTNKIKEANHNLVERKICKDNKKDMKVHSHKFKMTILKQMIKNYNFGKY